MLWTGSIGEGLRRQTMFEVSEKNIENPWCYLSHLAATAQGAIREVLDPRKENYPIFPSYFRSFARFNEYVDNVIEVPGGYFNLRIEICNIVQHLDNVVLVTVSLLVYPSEFDYPLFFTPGFLEILKAVKNASARSGITRITL